MMGILVGLVQGFVFKKIYRNALPEFIRRGLIPKR